MICDCFLRLGIYSYSRTIQFNCTEFWIWISFQNVTLNEVNDENNGDSSDSEGEDAEYASDDDAELSFESDDEGNYQQNQKRAAEIARKFSENDSDFIDGDEEAESNEDDEDDEEDDGEEEAESNEDDDDEEEVESIDGEQSAGEADDGADSELSFESSDDEQVEETPKTVEKNKKNKKPTTNGHSVGGAATNGESGKPKVSAAEAFENVLNGRDPSKKEEVDEYAEHDTDDEEDIRNTVGNIPMHWYDEYKHIGYDWDAKKIIKPAKRDQLDDFLKRMEDPDFWRTVKDPQTGQDVILSDADIDLIKRINSQRIPDADFDDYTVRILAIDFDTIVFMWCDFIFLVAMGRMVHIGSGKNANKKCAGSQAFVHSIDIGEEESVEIGARTENGLDENHRRSGQGESEERTAILHAVGNGYGQRGYAAHSRSRIGPETRFARPRWIIQSAARIFVRRKGSQRMA